MNTQAQQLEIALAACPSRRPASARFRRTSRARWWFAQMRRVVDEAVEGEPAATSLCQQTASLHVGSSRR